MREETSAARIKACQPSEKVSDSEMSRRSSGTNGNRPQRASSKKIWLATKPAPSRTVRLGAGLVANQIFFDDARCGLLPFVPELRRDISESDTFSEGWQALMRAADVSSRMLRRRLKFTFQAGTSRATALVLRAGEGQVQVGSMPESRLPVFRGTAFHFGPFSYLASLLRGSVGGEWQGGRQENFTCRELSLQVQPGTWILL